MNLFSGKENWVMCLDGFAFLFADINWKILKKQRLQKNFYRKRGLWVGQNQKSVAFHRVTALIISSVAGIMLKSLEEVAFPWFFQFRAHMYDCLFMLLGCCVSVSVDVFIDKFILLVCLLWIEKSFDFFYSCFKSFLLLTKMVTNLQNIQSCTRIEVFRMIVLDPNKMIPTPMLLEQYRGRLPQMNSC